LRFAKPWLAGWLSLSAASILHEFVSFGYTHGYFTGERNLGYGVYPTTAMGIVIEALVISALAGVAIAVVCALIGQHIVRLILAAALWLILCRQIYFMTAFGYRGDFGTTWLWREPFWALMWSPWLTPLATLLGLLPFLWSIRNR
jgi:hypothetical protein